ncbi:12311_t:CDS:2, partial [Racocetra persica]
PIPNNAVAQKNSFEKIKELKTELSELEKMITIITNFQHHNDLRSQIIERRVPIYRKPVSVKYIDKESNSCDEIEFTIPEKTNTPSLKEDNSSVPWLWIESYYQICENNGFLSLVIKRRDGHYLNAMHTLQYFNNLKIPAYDTHLLFLFSDDHS